MVAGNKSATYNAAIGSEQVGQVGDGRRRTGSSWGAGLPAFKFAQVPQNVVIFHDRSDGFCSKFTLRLEKIADGDGAGEQEVTAPRTLARENLLRVEAYTKTNAEHEHNHNRCGH